MHSSYKRTLGTRPNQGLPLIPTGFCLGGEHGEAFSCGEKTQPGEGSLRRAPDGVIPAGLAKRGGTNVRTSLSLLFVSRPSSQYRSSRLAQRQLAELEG